MLDGHYPLSTPWGEVDFSEEVVPGVYEIGTPSHGGLYVAPERNKMVPYAWRKATFNGQGRLGWYEEDGDWIFPYLAFAEEITAAGHGKRVGRARETFARRFPGHGLHVANKSNHEESRA